MNSITVVLLIIAIEIALLVVALIVGLTVFIRKTRATLDDTQNLVKSLEERVNELSKELGESLKNTTEATVHLKKTLNNTEKATAFINTALPILSLVLLWKGITLPLPAGVNASEARKKNSSIMGAISNIGKWMAAAGQGYMIYKKYFNSKMTRGGKNNGRK